MPSPHSIVHARTWPEQNGAAGQAGRNLKFEISDFGLLLGAANLVQPFQEFHPLSPRIGGAAGPFGEIALAGDIASNTAYYSLVGLAGRGNEIAAGTLLGLAAGIGAVTLPGPLGLGEEPSARSPQTKVMTVAWYIAGGLAAGLIFRSLSDRRD